MNRERLQRLIDLSNAGKFPACPRGCGLVAADLQPVEQFHCDKCGWTMTVEEWERYLGSQEGEAR